jgi:AcrR family transcriptional regulator
MLPTAGAPGAYPESIEDGKHADAAADKVGRGGGRDSAICDAALALLAEVGYDRMSMDAVAARARASKATIYRRWPGKRELVLEAVRSRAPEAMEPPDTGTLRGDIVATLRLMADGIGGQDAALMAGVLRAMKSTPELGDCMRTQVLEQKRYIGRTLVARAVARGELPAGADAEVWHEVAPALMFFRILVADGAVDDAFLTHVADDVLVPLLVRSGQATAQAPQEKK